MRVTNKLLLMIAGMLLVQIKDKLTADERVKFLKLYGEMTNEVED